MSQDELGLRAGILQSRLSRAERGYARLTADERTRVAAALQVEPAALDRVTK